MPSPQLVSHSELSAWGYSSRRRRSEAVAALLVPLRAGLFAIRDEWERATPEQRIVARAHALARVSGEPPVFSHETAAALLGLPLHAPDPTVVHAIIPTARPGAARGVVRHRGSVDPNEVVVTDGVQFTSMRRTVADVARTASFERAVTVADAALRSLFLRDADHDYDYDYDYDYEAAREFASSTLDTARRSAHGARRAARVLAFADGRADRPGESVSRIRLAQLGFAPPRLQVRVPQPDSSRSYYVDFAMEDAQALGEFDGRIKYEDGRFLVDRTADEVFQSEKEREDWIRGVTGRPLVRWGWAHIATPEALGTRLRAFGVTPRADHD